MEEGTTKTLEERQIILHGEIAKWVAKGYTVQSTTPSQAILTRKKKIKLITHILIALLTAGIWLLVPLWQLINRKQNSVIITIDAFGQVSTN